MKDNKKIGLRPLSGKNNNSKYLIQKLLRYNVVVVGITILKHSSV